MHLFYDEPLAQRVTTNGKEKSYTFAVLERASLRLTEHEVVWKLLQDCAHAGLAIDANHPEEAFPAKTIKINEMPVSFYESLEDSMADARRASLLNEKMHGDDALFSKRLDKDFAQQLEWLHLRTLFIQDFGYNDNKSSKKSKENYDRFIVLV